MPIMLHDKMANNHVSVEHAIELCRVLSRGGITLPDYSAAFKKKAKR